MRRSFTGPIVLLVVGGLFLWNNLHPESSLFDLFARYWPFLLIGWGLLRLFEVAVSSDRQYIRFSGGEVVLVVMICVIGSAVWEAREHGVRFNARGVEMFGEQYDFNVSAQGSAAGMTRITFENPRGSIKVVGGDTNDVVSVTGHKVIRAWSRQDADHADQTTPVEIVPQGDRLLIRTNQDRVPDNQRISDDLEVTIPKRMSVEARGRNGDYEISDLTGDVELASDRGDARLARLGGNARIEIGHSDVVRATDVKGTIDLQGRGGDIEFENIQGQVTINGSYLGNLEFKNLVKPIQFEGTRNTELHAAAVPGHISMDLSQFNGTNITGPIRLVTGSRDIKLEQFTQSLELESTRGDVELTPGRTPLPSIEAKSGAGRVDLVLPPKATFDLQATAQRGDATNDYGSPIEKEVDRRTSMLRGKVGDGPSIRITSNHGSVSVRKEGTAPSQPPTPPGKSEKDGKKTGDVIL